jgi:hypothetical protein
MTMPAASAIAKDKIQAYLSTRYRIACDPQAVVLLIGQRSDDLAALFTRHAVDCGAFLTAFNPRGALQSDDANEQAHARLKAALRGRGLALIEGEGIGATGNWPPERSVFALGLGLEEARAIGARFDQDAIVWVGAGAVPQLVLLR